MNRYIHQDLCPGVGGHEASNVFPLDNLFFGGSIGEAFVTKEFNDVQQYFLLHGGALCVTYVTFNTKKFNCSLMKRK